MILTEPKNALVRQYTKIFELDGIRLTFTDEALDLVVSKTMEQKLGARGLRAIMEQVMVEPMYELPSQGVTEFASMQPSSSSSSPRKALPLRSRTDPAA